MSPNGKNTPQGHILNSLLTMLAGLIHSPAQAQQKYGAQGVVYRLDAKKEMHQIGLAAVLFPIIK